MPTPEEFKKTLQSHLDVDFVDVSDTSGGCGQAFEVTVVSKLFEGKNKLMRHRLVNAALKSQIAAVHAFTQHNFSPSEWANKNGAA